MNNKLRNILIVLSLLLAIIFVFTQNKDRLMIKRAKSKGSVTSSKDTGNEEVEDKELRYGVSSANPVASEVGMKVLEDGGNAVDAAVAISFALNIVDPQNSGLGGGGGMLIKDEITGEDIFYDYYISSGDKEPIQNIGIPGFLKGMELINKEMGSKPLGELIQYSIDLGEEGVEITKDYADTLNEYSYISQVHPDFANDGKSFVEGDILYHTELVKTLKEIRDHGSQVFYNGEHPISKNFLEITGISKESLGNYEVKKYSPLEIDYRGYQVIAPPAPFSGLVLLQGLLIEEELDIPQHDLQNEEYINIMENILSFVEKEKRQTIGDPAFVDIDYDEKLDTDYLISSYTEDIVDNGDYEEPESVTTTVFSVIDKDGIIVSGTNTLSNYWGSYVVSDGIVYNNAMKNFTSGKNKFEYNKRPRTGITPVIITNESSYKEAIGTSGGVKIPAYLFQTIVNTKKNGIDMQSANDVGRMYYLKGQIHLEGTAPQSIKVNEANDQNEAPEFDRSGLWGRMNGIQIKEDNKINGHIDKRNYFDGGTIYYDGSKKIYN